MSDFCCEVWRPCPRFDGYEISSSGRVRVTRQRRYLKPNDFVRLNKSPNGYVIAYIEGTSRSIHRLACEAFHGAPPSPLHEVAHNNGIRDDNRHSNLRWATRKENSADKIRHGTNGGPRGEQQGRSILRERDIPKIMSKMSKGITQLEIANSLGVHRTTISAVVNGYNWRHITKQLEAQQ